ncbi:hypothetical protein HGRIS_011392 [Hohenbuehelia grisea]|uniref:RRM domain-containing protein n=1 Tax=Hohenbuehelia grisea TaxID=104357 RepID=A0ABR3JV57_9AGAR
MSAIRARKPYSRSSAIDGQWEHDKAHLGGGAPRNARGPKRTPIAAPTEMPNSKLLVSNLHYEITPKDLNSIFGQIGTLVREPLIRYDRSGRSSGVAVITYESPADATKAKKQYDGILAKGQPMEIAFDKSVTRRSASEPNGPTTASLLNRIQKQPLLERLSNADKSKPQKAESQRRDGPGPVRNRKGRGAGAGPKTKAQPKSAEELDKELEAFMAPSDATGDVSGAELAVNKSVSEDVEMA